VTDYKRFQSFIQSKGLWEEFKEKTLKNYSHCGINMYQYYKLIAECSEGWNYEEDLIISAFPYAQVRYSDNHPDHVWADLHQAWVDHINPNKPSLQLLKD
jgi:hypothetical protein